MLFTGTTVNNTISIQFHAEKLNLQLSPNVSVYQRKICLKDCKLTWSSHRVLAGLLHGYLQGRGSSGEAESSADLNLVDKRTPVSLSQDSADKGLRVELLKFVHVLSCSYEGDGALRGCHSSQSTATLGMPIHLCHDHTTDLRAMLRLGC